MNPTAKVWKWPAVLTGAIVLAIASVLLFTDSTAPKTWSDWGQLIGGIVAPIALIWLIFGYAQQEKAVASNTEGLAQQEAALNRQFEVTSLLVRETGRYAQAIEEQNRLARDAVKPIFEIADARQLGHVTATFVIRVLKATAYDMEFEVGGGKYKVTVNQHNSRVWHPAHYTITVNSFGENVDVLDVQIKCKSSFGDTVTYQEILTKN